ncbi:MAG: M2 family metallopeptidase [Myxococcales bacterium]|nr:M2 family metallopeptidase [Myxococcales bacterium]
MHTTKTTLRRQAGWLATVLIAALSISATSQAAAKPTIADAQRFMQRTEKELERLLSIRERAAFVNMTYLTEDTDFFDSHFQQELMAFVGKSVKEAVRFRGLKLPATLARKFHMLRINLDLPAPSDAALRAELAQIASYLTSTYGKGKYCKTGADGRRNCRNLGQLSKVMATSRNFDELLDAWRGWRTIAPPMRKKFARYVTLANAGAKELGFKNLGDLWRSKYDMSPEAFEKETERLWKQVKPLYRDLHCYVRAQLSKHYGADKVPLDKPIPAHLLGNMWSQTWENIYPLVAPKTSERAPNVTAALLRKGLKPKQMTKIAENFFVSLGMPTLPKTFWNRSLFTKPRDREVVCHASAWTLDFKNDVRIKMCIKIDEEDLSTLHHELGHVYYYLAYRGLPVLFQTGAHDGFHEAVGDLLALSVTPDYLKAIEILQTSETGKPGLSFLLKMALEKVAFLPFGKLIDQWRWHVFEGRIKPREYNASWWRLRTTYQGIVPPVSRSESDFDPGAKYHIAANVPYTRYFLATILQFQFHRALCKAIGHKGPLHACSIYGNKIAGKRLWKMLQLGASGPWPEALHELTGQRRMDATAILSYFAPLHKWLKEQNKGQRCGW